MITDLDKQGDMIYNHFQKMNQKRKQANMQRMIEVVEVRQKPFWITTVFLTLTGRTRR